MLTRIRSMLGRVKDSALPSALREAVDRQVTLADYRADRRRWMRRVQGAPTEALTVLFYPDLPTKYHAIWNILAAAGHRITDDPSGDVDLVVRWKDTTVWGPDESLLRLAERLPVVNLAASDITKGRVNEVFQDVFGYSIGVDPTRYHGPIVVKSQANATHDGRLVEGPLDVPDPAMTYQRLIETAVDGDPPGYEILRTPVLAGEVPVVYRRIRPADDRFGGATLRVRLHAPDEVYTPDELDGLRRLAAGLGLDHAEMDVLRHQGDGRIYVVDANNTPWGPPVDLTEDERTRAVEAMLPLIERLARTPVAS